MKAQNQFNPQLQMGWLQSKDQFCGVLCVPLTTLCKGELEEHICQTAVPWPPFPSSEVVCWEENSMSGPCLPDYSPAFHGPSWAMYVSWVLSDCG